MKSPILNVFKKGPAGKHVSETHSHSTAEAELKLMPAWWAVVFAYLLVVVFCYLIHQVLTWFTPYLEEVFKNLRNLPIAWADLGLYWTERGLKWIAVAAAVYHHLWQLGTRYRLTHRDLRVEQWFPVRRVTAVPFGAIRRIGYVQSPLGLLLNSGRVEIDTSSPLGPLMLENCPRPKKVAGILQTKVESVLQPSLSHHKRATDL